MKESEGQESGGNLKDCLRQEFEVVWEFGAKEEHYVKEGDMIGGIREDDKDEGRRRRRRRRRRKRSGRRRSRRKMRRRRRMRS